jgi:hypothetical protein
MSYERRRIHVTSAVHHLISARNCYSRGLMNERSQYKVIENMPAPADLRDVGAAAFPAGFQLQPAWVQHALSGPRDAPNAWKAASRCRLVFETSRVKIPNDDRPDCV